MTLSPSSLDPVLADYTRRTGKPATVDGLLSSMIRSCYTAGPDRVLLVIDYAQIEARYVNWLAGQEDALERFRLFDASSKEDKPKYDPYRVLAGKVFGVAPETIPKDDIRRHVGKTGELGCGFGMGRGKFGLYAALNGINLEDVGVTPKQVIDAYRGSHGNVKRLWSEMGHAALDVVSGKETETYCGKSYFRMVGGALTMRLPSGRYIWYQQAQVQDLVPAYCKMYGLEERAIPTVTYLDGRKGRISTYGGKLVENATQGGARDLLGQAMLRLESQGFPVVLTVHDEWIGEVPDQGDSENLLALHRAEGIMSAVPDWATGCPVVVEGFVAARYRK